MKKKLEVPKFNNDDDEFEFWSGLDLSEFFEPGDFKPVSFPNLKPTTRPISLRLPEFVIERVKEQANEINVPYQSLMKQYIARGAAGGRITKNPARDTEAKQPARKA